MDINHPIQRSILLKLIHTPEATFTELLGDERDSNKFAYHIGVLETKNIILKNNNKYTLSAEGKKISAFIEGDTGSDAKFPTFTNVLIIKDDNNKDRILVQKRLKEPFYGYWGLISGKINFGLNIEECAKRDIEEETGLIAADAQFLGINEAKTFEDSNLSFHHIMFYVRLSNLSGTLKQDTHKGKNAWMTIDEFKRQERFPDPWLEQVLNAKEFIHIETRREMKDGKFTDCKKTLKREF
jgi:ADP-ribose pyrophosphatase YjhB (NUDIX family)